VTPGPLIVAGGTAGSEMFADLLAGATSGAITRIEDGRWISARGAAIIAAISAGAIDGERDIPAPARVTCEPRQEDAAAWEALAERHDDRLRRAR
jgi:sugar (pentulose or hexulose) kinase